MAKAERKAQHDIFLYNINDLQLEAIGGVEFTHREIDIIACILSGKTAKKIAAFLSISPKTVENHIRNIMLKLGCRTQENIIDFIERSSKFLAIKKHYSSLLLQSFFEAELKKLAEQGRQEQKVCALFYNTECREHASFVTRFAANLKLCGLTPIVINKQLDAIDQKIDYILYINVANDGSAKQLAIQNVHSFAKIEQLSMNQSAQIIYVLLNKSSNSTNEKLLSTENMIVIEQQNYYLLFFETIKRILKHNIDENINDFKRQLDELTDVIPVHPISSIASNKPQKTQAIVKPSSKRTFATSIAMLIICLACVGLLFVKGSDSINSKGIVLSTIFDWLRERDSCASSVAAKYVESLEEEECKLGKIESTFDMLRFLNLRSNFIRLSNALLGLSKTDDQGAQTLVQQLHEKFPLTHRTNEKIHKLFYAQAAYYGKLNFIEYLMDNAQVSFGDARDYYGNTAPMLAAAGNNLNTFKWLAKKDALFINHTNVEGNTALILAALSLSSDEKLDDKAKLESIMVLKKVYEYDHASLRHKGHKGCTALLVAGAKGNITAVKYLLELLAPNDPAKQLEILQNERNADGNNMMMLAAYNGRDNVIQWLYKQGISIRQRNNYNTTAFMQAASGGSIRAMETIYRLNQESGHKPEELLFEQNNFGQTALFLAVHDNHINAFQWIMVKLHKTTFHNNHELIENYLARAKNSDGDSLLHVLINGMSDTRRFAESSLNTGLLDILLDYLDVNTHTMLENDVKGDTPLMRAAYYGNLAIVKYLVEECAANPHLTNERGEKAIDYAAMGGHGQYINVIEYLWDLEAAHEHKNFIDIKRGHSAHLFLTAAKYGQKSVVEWLLRDDPELIDARNASGDNALTLAIRNAHIDVIEFIFNWDRKTAVRLALEKRAESAINIIDQIILDEKNGLNKKISLTKYLEQKLGIPLSDKGYRSTKHSDSSYRWRTLDIEIPGLSTSNVQPWSPYYLHHDPSLKIISE